MLTFDIQIPEPDLGLQTALYRTERDPLRKFNLSYEGYFLRDAQGSLNLHFTPLVIDKACSRY